MRPRSALLLPLLGLILLGTITATAGSALNEAGKTAYARGDYAGAERLFSRALSQAPDEPLLHYHRGIALMRLSWQEAAAAFQTALRLNPSQDVAAAAREGLHSLAPILREAAPRSAGSDDDAVSLRRVGGNWFAQVRLNDSRTARFLVDTARAPA